jgi:hypothetical protein
MAMAPGGFAYNSDAFEDYWRATNTYYSKKIIDMLPRAHPLLDKIAGHGNISGKEGGVGKRVVETILARPHRGVKWVGFKDPITVTNETLLEQIEYDWKFCMLGFEIYDKMLSINKSSELVDMLDINQKAVREGFAIDIANQLYSGKSDEFHMGGLQYLLSENPYTDYDASGNKQPLVVLNLQRSGTPGDKYEFWRNRVGEWWNVASSTVPGAVVWPADQAKRAEMLVEAMGNMIMTINNGNDTIDGIYTNAYFYNLYKSYMQNKLMINNVASEKKDAGFTNLEFMGIPVYFDRFCPTSKIFFLNSKYLHFKYLEGENFKQTIKENPTYFSKKYITTFIGNFIIEKPRSQGVITLHVHGDVPTGDTALPLGTNICDFANYVDYDYEPLVSYFRGNDHTTEWQGASQGGVARKKVK